MITTFGPMFYGTLVCLLFPLVFILVMTYRRQLWVKRTHREIEGIRFDGNRKAEEIKSSIMDYLTKNLPEALKLIIRDMVESCVREEIDKFFPSPEISVEPTMVEKEMSPEDVEFSPTFESQTVSSETPEWEDYYVDIFLKKPDVSLNDIGTKRISLSSGQWNILHILCFVKEEPISVSAMVRNIISDHIRSHATEIKKFARIGQNNMKYGYGRY